jgi:hypothetical protein
MNTHGSRVQSAIAWLGVFVCLMLAVLFPAMLWPSLRAGAAEPEAAASPPSLAVREAELLAQYRELERSFLRLADLLDASDPRRGAGLFSPP